MTTSQVPLLIELEFARAEQAGDPYGVHFAAQEYLLRTPGGGFESARLTWDPSLLGDLAQARHPQRDPAVLQRLGEALRRFLLPLGWSELETQILEASRQERRVLLTVRSAAAELYTLPWELLTLKATGQHIGELSGVLVRYEWPETASAAVQTKGQAWLHADTGRVLFAWSAAGGAVPAAEHLSALQSACRAGSRAFDPNRDVLAHASAEQITTVLAAAQKDGAPISVLHLLCHGAAAGSTFGLALDASSGQGPGAAVVDAGRLRQLLAPYAGMVRLVVLMACDSGNSGALGNHLGSVAQTLHRAGMAAVIASRFPLSTVGSVRLAGALYARLLGELDSLEGALLAARQQLACETDELDWASVQLYARAADGADTRPLIFRPYRGLLAFGPEHRRFFFGREQEAAEVHADLAALRQQHRPRFLVIAGASGTGKSSLVLSKVVPELCEREGYDAHVIRPAAGGPAALEDLLRARGGAGRPLLIVVDQFEEIFTALSPPERTAFVQRLWQLARDAASGLSVLATLRVDFIGHCGEVAVETSGAGLRLDAVAYAEAHRIFVAQLGAAGLRQAIEGPAARVGIVMEPGLVDRLLADVGNEPGALPLLQYTLDELWQRRRGSTLTQAAYQELGGVSGALRSRADALIDTLSPDEQQTARRLLLRLMHVAEGAPPTRQRVPVSKLRSGEPAEARRFDSCLALLVGARLLVCDGAGDQQTVEVAHEALIRTWPRLAAWVREDRQRLVEIEKLESWAAQYTEHKDLLRGQRLRYANTIEMQYPQDLSDAVKQLLRRSRLWYGAIWIAGIVGTMAVLVFWWSNAGKRSVAESLAEERLEAALDVISAVVSTASQELADVPGARAARKEILDIADRRLFEFEMTTFRSATGWKLDRERARLTEELGDIALAREELQTAKEQYEFALFHRESALRNAPSRERIGLLDPLELQCKLGDVALQANKPEDARQCYLRCERFWEQDLKEHAESGDKGWTQRKLAEIATRLGDVALQQGSPERAKAEYERSLKMLSELASAQPKQEAGADSARVQLPLLEGTAPNLIGLGRVAQKQEQKTQAHDYYQRALEMRTKLAEANPNSERAQQDLADSLELALTAADLDESSAAATASLRLAIAASVRVAAAEPLKTDAEERVLRLQLRLVTLLHRSGQPAPLELEYARALLAHLRPRLVAQEAEKLDAALAAADQPELLRAHHRPAHHLK